MTKTGYARLAGGALAALTTAAIAVYLLRDPIEPLSPEAFAAAQARWNERGLTDYDVEVVFSGEQTGDYQAEIRSGAVVRLVRNGRDLPNRGSAWRSWTIPGMFEILEMDLAKQPATPTAGQENPASPSRANVRVSAEFDESLGYPKRYRRLDLDRNQSTEWRIERFVEVTPSTRGN